MRKTVLLLITSITSIYEIDEDSIWGNISNVCVRSNLIKSHDEFKFNVDYHVISFVTSLCITPKSQNKFYCILYVMRN